MKKIFLLLSICLLLTGCAASDPVSTPDTNTTTAPATVTSATEATAVPEETTLPSAVKLTVEFQYLTEDSNEYARITATDESGVIHWSLETNRHEMAQLTGLWGIGSHEDRYYYTEHGHVIALDIATGKELWRNTEFGGYPGNRDCYFIDDNGDIILTGFMGPDYFRVSAEGQTLQRIGTLHPDYFWASSVRKADGQITVYFSAGPEGDMGGDYYSVTVEEN